MDRYWQQSLAEISQRVGKIARSPCHIVAAAMTGNGFKAGIEQQRVLVLDAGNQPQRQAFLAADMVRIEGKARNGQLAQ